MNARLLPSAGSDLPRMRVLIVYKDYFPVLGGIENHIRYLAEGLRSSGVDARVLVTNTADRTARETIGGVPVTKCARLGRLSSAPLSLAFVRAFRTLAREVDLVHLHMPYPPAELTQLAFGAGPFVVTYHSDIVRQRLMGALYTPFARRLLHKARAVSVSNPNYINRSRLLGRVADKCTVIHHGIDLTRFTGIERETAPPTNGPPTILAVGKFRHYKGFDVLIRAMRDTPRARAVLVGAGPMDAAWRSLARELRLGERVTFAGEVDDAGLLEHYRNADLFVLPSVNRAESWGTVLIEAMASGLPVISTELGTGTSYINQNGMTGCVVPPNDSQALAGAVNKLLGDPHRRHAMGQAARQRALDEFGIERMIRDTRAWYAGAIRRQAC